MGELSDLGILDLIELLTRRQQTGRLTVKADGREAELYLAEGRIMLASTSDLTLRLGRMLIKLGIITTQQLLEALHGQAEGDRPRPLGAILLERGLVTEAQLARCVEEQCVEVLARVIAARQGMFLYTEGERPPRDLEAIPLAATEVLAAASERTERLRRLRSLLPAPTAPLVFNDRDPGALNNLAPEEAEVIKVMRSGVGSLAELAAHLALDEATLGSAVLSLRDRGAIFAAPSAKVG